MEQTLTSTVEMSKIGAMLLISIVFLALIASFKFPEILVAIFLRWMFILENSLNVLNIPEGFKFISLFGIFTSITVFHFLKLRKQGCSVLKKSAFFFLLTSLLAGIFFLGLLYSSYFDFGFNKAKNFLLMSLVLSFYTFIMLNKSRQIHNIVWIIFIIGMVQVLYCGLMIMLQDYAAIYRASLLDGGAIIFSRNLGLSALASYYLYFISKRRVVKLIMIFAIAAIWTIDFASGGRGAVVALVIATSLWFLIAGKRFTRKKQTVFFGFGLLLIVVIVVTTFRENPGIERVMQFFSSTDPSEHQLRYMLWLQALKDINSHPFLGIGTGSFYLPFYSPYGTLTGFEIPHSVVLEIAAENGLFTLGIFLSTFAYVVSKGYVLIFSKKLTTKDIMLSIWCFVSLFFIFIDSCWQSRYDRNFQLWLSMTIMLVLCSIYSIKCRNFRMTYDYRGSLKPCGKSAVGKSE